MSCVLLWCSSHFWGVAEISTCQCHLKDWIGYIYSTNIYIHIFILCVFISENAWHMSCFPDSYNVPIPTYVAYYWCPDVTAMAILAIPWPWDVQSYQQIPAEDSLTPRHKDYIRYT